MGMEMPMVWDGYGDVINRAPTGLCELSLWGFLSKCEIQWKRFKHGVNVIVDALNLIARFRSD